MDGELISISTKLQQLLGVDSEQVQFLLSYLSSVGEESQVREYLGSLLPASGEVNAFVDKCVKYFAKKNGGGTPKSKPAASAAPKVKVSVPKVGASAKKPTTQNASTPKSASSTPKSKKKSQFQVLRSTDETKHENLSAPTPIITGNEGFPGGVKFQNCLACGKIYTDEKYASLSKCEFCSEPVGRAQLKKGRQELLQQNQPGLDQTDGLASALAHRDKLLDFDATSASRTQVFDDQSDYFEMDIGIMNSKWATSEERQAVRDLAEQRLAEAEEAASKRYLAFDIAGRRVVEDRGLHGTASEVYARLAEALR